MTREGKVRAFALAVAVIILAAGLTGLWLIKRKPELVAGHLGAPFSLVDQSGQPITEQALEGHPSLLYFGFTHCPEVCPTTLYEMSGWFKTLGSEAKDLRAFFVSVDPERDTPEVMKGYVTAFGDRITGITGSPSEIQKVITGWRIYAVKVPQPGGDYVMDHTASVMLLDRSGQFSGTISYGEKTDVALSKIRRLLAE